MPAACQVGNLPHSHTHTHTHCYKIKEWKVRLKPIMQADDMLAPDLAEDLHDTFGVVRSSRWTTLSAAKSSKTSYVILVTMWCSVVKL